MARWTADGAFGGNIHAEARKAYLHMAEELDVLAREMRRARRGGAVLTAVPDDVRAA